MREYTFGSKQAIGYGMEECEERLLIAYFHEIEGKIRPGAVWKNDFLSRFYETGEGVSELNINYINSERRRNRLPEFEVRQTQIFEYGKETDRSLKAKARVKIRDEYFALDTVEKLKWVEDAKDGIARLPEPHFTREEHAMRREATFGGLSDRELAMRQTAWAAKDVPPVVFAEVKPSEADRAIRLLNIPTKPETVDRIITKLAPDDALTVAESGKITDPDILDKLVNRSLD